MQTADRYRRVRGVVIYWIGAQAVCFIGSPPIAFPFRSKPSEFCSRLTEWVSIAEIRGSDRPGGDTAM